MSKKRLEIIKELKKLETRKNAMENALNDVDDYYFKSADIILIMETQSHNRKYDGKGFEINTKLFKEYLINEINNLERQITVLIADLTN